MAKTVLVMGASGLFGSRAVQAFGAAGWAVNKYQRGSDPVEAGRGVDVVVNAMNPPMYHDWKRLVPQIAEQGLKAAGTSGATLIVPGNVYVYGQEPAPWGPQTRHNPVSRKGAIRAEMEARLRAASENGQQVIILRGGDFIDPEAPSTFLNMIILKGLAKGRMTTAAPMDVPRAWAYLPDMTRAVVALADRRDSLPAFNDVPFAGYTFSMADLKADLERLTGRDVKVSRFAWWAMTLAAPFWELARELREMRYLYDLPHRLDGKVLGDLLPDFRQTSFEVVLKDHVERLVPQSPAMVTQTGR